MLNFHCISLGAYTYHGHTLQLHHTDSAQCTCIQFISRSVTSQQVDGLLTGCCMITYRVYWKYFPGLKRLGRETVVWLCVVQVVNAWSFISTPGWLHCAVRSSARASIVISLHGVPRRSDCYNNSLTRSCRPLTLSVVSVDLRNEKKIRHQTSLEHRHCVFCLRQKHLSLVPFNLLAPEFGI
jgi:hypothetical protein